MFNEPILAALPASEDEIIAAFPRVCPDVIRRRIRTLELAVDKKAGGYLRKMGDKFYLVKRRKDGPLSRAPGVKKKPGNRKMGVRHCRYCKTVLAPDGCHGSTDSPMCPACFEKGQAFRKARMHTRVCPACGVEKGPMRRNFRKIHIGHTTGYAKVCLDCEHAAA